MSYTNTFIRVAQDSKTAVAVVPPERAAGKTVAAWQYELLAAHPYQLTERELYFRVHCGRKEISAREAKAQRKEILMEIFAKPQACLRASPLPKSYGWGVHYDAEGRIGLVGVESEEYRKLSESGLKQVYAMRSKR
ncbi:MAG: DUF6157 family protein [Luteolibacter sp.]|uniref:DUF6157 family protein n=1 Tax=Luteolibacter sp. TaxID=1962973 RepID=UPI003265636A